MASLKIIRSGAHSMDEMGSALNIPWTTGKHSGQVVNMFWWKPTREDVEILFYFPALPQRSLDMNTLMSIYGHYLSNKSTPSWVGWDIIGTPNMPISCKGTQAAENAVASFEAQIVTIAKYKKQSIMTTIYSFPHSLNTGNCLVLSIFPFSSIDNTQKS